MKPNCLTEITKKRITSRSLLFLLLMSLFILSICITASVAQTNKGVLEIPVKGVFLMPEETLDLDELIMLDSSKIILNKSSKSSINVRRMSVGRGCQIIGDGLPGIQGKNGKAAAYPMGLCKSGMDGETGKPGPDGEQGRDLILDVVQLELSASLGISLVGGTGGDGGNGGKGSTGSKSTIHCASNGGNGGAGGNGGNGGRGGVLTLRAQNVGSSDLLARINLNNRGGYRGLGGEGGTGGLRGTGSERNSKHGLKGKPGTDGKNGQEGRPLFYSIARDPAAPVSSAIN